MLPSVAFAEMTLAPFFSPVTTPRMRPLACCENRAVLSVPSRSTLRVAGTTKPGVLISTRAEPPLTRSARLDRVVIAMPLVGGTFALSSLPPQADRTSDANAPADAATRRRWMFTACLQSDHRFRPADRDEEGVPRHAARRARRTVRRCNQG